MEVSFGISFNNAATVPVNGNNNLMSVFINITALLPAGNFSKAASVGAKTVKGPGPLSVGTRPAAVYNSL
jgi:hypothetical protein